MKLHPSPPSLRLLHRAAAPLLALLALVLLATACRDSDDFAPARQPISFGATLLQPAASGAATTTRATTQGSFAQGDRIALRIDGQVKPYTYDAGTGRFTSPDPFYWPVGATSIKDVLAWYPYSDRLPLDFMPSDSQHEDAEHAASDFLSTGSVTLTRASSSAGSLTFAHRTAQLEFHINADPRTLPGGAEITGVTLNGVGLTTSVDPTHGTLNHVTGSVPRAISAHLRSATSATKALYEALIVPQGILPGQSVSLSITATTPTGEKKFKGFLSGSDFEGGKSYAYNITLYADRITITPAEGDVPWEEGNIAPPAGYDLTVSNAEELKRFAEWVNSGQMIPGTNVRAYDARVLQTANIDLAGIGNWTPIGYWRDVLDNQPFQGAYNGNGYTISNLTITGGGQYNGLFGRVWGKSAADHAVLTGIHLREVKMVVNTDESYSNSGAIVGQAYGTTVISFCTAQGEIKAKCSGTSNSTGGIAGSIYETDVINHCRTSVVIDAAASTTQSEAVCRAGGIVGINWGIILACESSGSRVSAKGYYDAYAGGIAGWTAFVSKAYFCASQMEGASATDGTKLIYAGGLIGNNNGTLASSYARTKATATAVPSGASFVQAGAIVGCYASPDNNISYCIGLGAAGQGTSNLDDTANIVYNPDASDTQICDLVSQYPDPVTIKTTTYDATRFPAYGIELTEQTFSATGAGGIAVWESPTAGGAGKIRLRSLPPISAAP